jgi:hypothetical protein
VSDRDDKLKKAIKLLRTRSTKNLKVTGDSNYVARCYGMHLAYEAAGLLVKILKGEEL